ncbi:MAG: LysR family transcriptional regulator [Propionibacteriaceae bacterium]
MFSLEQVRGFVAVAEELHFGRAADRLNMSQPPLSRQIQKLEKAIGVQLLRRDNRQVTLTPAGDAFLAEARKLLSLATSAPDLARRISSGSAGVIRIGFTATAAYGGLEHLLNLLKRELPELSVDLHEMVTRDQIEALHKREVDVGLVRPPIDHAVFASRLIRKEPLVVALPRGHVLCDTGRPLTGHDLRHENLVMPDPVKARYFYDLAMGTVSMRNRPITHTVSQILTMVALVSAGLGVALVPASAKTLGFPSVEYRPLAGRENPVELHAVWRKDDDSPAVRRLIALLDTRPWDATPPRP